MPNNLTYVNGVLVISVVAWSNSGKTTLFEKVVSELESRGIKVGVIKHHSHSTPIDAVGKDSWRYSEAGASAVIISSPDEYGVFRRMPEGEASLVSLCEHLSDEVDLILTEGYKYEGMSKIEFSRKDFNPEPVESPENLIALISDNEERKADLDKRGLKTFNLDDVIGVSNFIESLMRS